MLRVRRHFAHAECRPLRLLQSDAPSKVTAALLLSATSTWKFCSFVTTDVFFPKKAKTKPPTSSLLNRCRRKNELLATRVQFKELTLKCNDLFKVLVLYFVQFVCRVKGQRSYLHQLISLCWCSCVATQWCSGRALDSFRVGWTKRIYH